MKKQRRSTAIREARRDTAKRKRLSLAFQQPGKGRPLMPDVASCFGRNVPETATVA